MKRNIQDDIYSLAQCLSIWLPKQERLEKLRRIDNLVKQNLRLEKLAKIKNNNK